MKSFVVFACLAVLSANAGPIGSLQDLKEILESQKLGNQAPRDNELGSDRSLNARALSSYTQAIKDNTAAASTKLDTVASATQSMTNAVSSIKSTIEAASAALQADMRSIKTAVTGDLLDTLRSINDNASVIKTVAISTDFTDTLTSQLAALSNILSDKLDSIEEIIDF